MPSNAAFRIAIIGAGGISNAHVGAAKSSGGRVSIVAAVDPNAENRAKLSQAVGGVEEFSAIDPFLKAVDAGFEVDGVFVCTPPSVRTPIVPKLLKSGIPTISEKPIASTLADARKLAAGAALAKKTRSAIGFCHRFTPAVNQMMALCAQGAIGRLLRFENFFACDLPGHETKWFSDPKLAGGGAYLDMGSHSVDLFRYMVGEGKTVGAVFDHKWKRRTETAASVLLSCTKAAKVAGKANPFVKEGAAGVIISGWAETSRFTVALVGDKGMLFYDYEKPSELVFKDLLGKAEVHAVESHDVRFTRQLVAFADLVQSRGKAKGAAASLATFDDGVAAAILNESAAKLAAKV
ncbi:MAG: Gfo/Idh/MocA family oxidoreductase [Planctomycetota bacterium]|nr:Gfo/Idh/MocA family oxidoreductase [Planctomycetota bacterium]